MAHYAFLNENNIVVNVITGVDENTLIDGITPEEHYSNLHGLKCLRTSYNGNIRKNFAGIGYSYDQDKDAFIPPKPFNRFVLNEETCKWESPIPCPLDDKKYVWNDNKGEWEEIIPIYNV
jgi:hypothetical protein